MNWENNFAVFKPIKKEHIYATMNVLGVVFHTKHNELTTFNLKGAMKKII